MALAPGTRLGPYEIDSALGAGGMGEVHRARDTKLGRDVVLPGGFRVAFTGHDVRWPDGQQFQRVGLITDVEFRPTIAGISGGRDEVLERAVAYLKAGLTSAPIGTSRAADGAGATTYFA